MSAALASRPALFGRLSSFTLNDWSSALVERDWNKWDSLLELQHAHIVDAGTMRGDLVSLTFGDLRWTRDFLRDEWSVVQLWKPDLRISKISSLDNSSIANLPMYYVDRKDCSDSDSLLVMYPCDIIYIEQMDDGCTRR